MAPKKTVGSAKGTPAQKHSAIKKRPAAKKAEGGHKKKRTETFSVYIYRVLKQVHPETGISKRSMNSFINDIFEKIASSRPSSSDTTISTLSHP